MKRIKFIITSLVLLFIASFILTTYSFMQAHNLEKDLRDDGFKVIEGESLSLLMDGYLYYFTKDQRIKTTRYLKNVNGVNIDLSITLESSKSVRGSSSYLPSLGILVKIRGKKSLFDHRSDYQCPDGRVDHRNKEYGHFDSTLENGIPIRPCYSQKLVDKLKTLEISETRFLDTTSVWLPQRGKVEFQTSLVGKEELSKRIQSLTIIYNALTY